MRISRVAKVALWQHAAEVARPRGGSNPITAAARAAARALGPEVSAREALSNATRCCAERPDFTRCPVKLFETQQKLSNTLECCRVAIDRDLAQAVWEFEREYVGVERNGIEAVRACLLYTSPSPRDS